LRSLSPDAAPEAGAASLAPEPEPEPLSCDHWACAPVAVPASNNAAIAAAPRK
jgi:hypothetical protein